MVQNFFKIHLFKKYSCFGDVDHLLPLNTLVVFACFVPKNMRPFFYSNLVKYVCMNDMTFFNILEIKPCGLGSSIPDVEADLIY